MRLVKTFTRNYPGALRLALCLELIRDCKEFRNRSEYFRSGLITWPISTSAQSVHARFQSSLGSKQCMSNAWLILLGAVSGAEAGLLAD